MATSSQAYANPAAGRVSQPAPSRADPCADPAPPCPVCGGLRCLCRPRFFPGQLLSDEDLNRLQQYVIDKNRLHNRYLVGWGVACGLEVACSPCDASAVTVRAGYALSPCGDDIVLCADQSVDLCALIQSCRPANPMVCDPPYSAPPSTCTQGVERWVLAVCYDERPTRGISALTGAGDSVAKPGCRCGGSAASCTCGGASGSSGACGCGGQGSSGCSCSGSSSAYQPVRQRRGLLPQCEPTQVCEGFRFTAYRAPAPRTGLTGRLSDSSGLGTANPALGGSGDLLIAWLYANRARFGPLLERTLCCVLRAMDLRATLAENRQLAAAGVVGVYRDYAQALQEFASEFSLHHCSFVDTVRGQYLDAVQWAGTRMTGQLGAADQAELSTRFLQLDGSWIQIATECFCSALLPACPPSANTNCVPLAVVTVNTGGSSTGAASTQRCQVVDICNWQERKLLITWPTILYWLSWLPWQRLRDFFARICCGSGRETTAYTLMMMMMGIAVAGARGTGTTTLATTASTSSALQPAGGLTGATLAGHAVAAPPPPTAPPIAPPPTQPPKQPQAPTPGSFEAAMAAPNLLQHMLADYEQARVGGDSAPTWAALAARVLDGTAFGPLAGNAAVRQVDLNDIDKKLGVDAMRTQLAALQQTVARQDEILRALQIVKGQGGTPSPAVG